MKVIEIVKNNKTIEESKNVMRIAAYARVSKLSLSQEESFTSQVDYYNNLFKDDNEKRLVKVYGDIGISGLRANKRH